MDIWSLARKHLEETKNKRISQQQQQQQQNGVQSHYTAVIGDLQATEIHLVICGSKNCGKTSMVFRFLDRNENPKPTVALEYTYGRRTRGRVKDVGHIWELGGGTTMSNLLQIPLSKTKIQKCSLMIVIDLTAPFDLWDTFYTLLDSARTATISAFENFAEKSPSEYEASVEDRKTRFKDSKDVEFINPFPIPLVLLGAKYDEFQNFEPELRKNICKILRFMAHSNGATLAITLISYVLLFLLLTKQLTSELTPKLITDHQTMLGWSVQHRSASSIDEDTKMENLVIRVRALISSMIFGTSAPKTICTDHNKPLSIPCGADSLMDIGVPPRIDVSLSNIDATNPRDLWHQAYLELFPAKEKQYEREYDPADDAKYREPEIDELIEQRTRELEQYIRHKKERALLEAGTELQEK